ncbi:hypothetical protein E4T50_08190 [Aureobasidium sp. EXF-12298]|nr:hypothetical protein E4T50_08190 [Aureobasidium sp. EXF-12298]
MQFTIAAIAAFAASASAVALNSTAAATPVYVTEVVTHLTTFCPAATVVTAGSHTITVTAATTLTIEDCSCTITSLKSTASAPSAPAAPVVTAPAAPYNNGTIATKTQGMASGTGVGATSTKPAHFTGAASAMNVAGAAAAALGMAALIL